jgi:NAD(P)-dependent dehydrogenase (short-subunit alcohol dehydrogenase family)
MWRMDQGLRRQAVIVTGAGLVRVAAAPPPGRLVTAEECARLAVFLLSDASVPMGGAI